MHFSKGKFDEGLFQLTILGQQFPKGSTCIPLTRGRMRVWWAFPLNAFILCYTHLNVVKKKFYLLSKLQKC